MDSARWVRGRSVWLVRSVTVLLAGALVVSACGDDESSKTGAQPGGAAGDASAGEATSSGGSAVTGGDTGQGGSGVPASAGSGDAGDTGVAGSGGGGSEGIDIDQFCQLTLRARAWLRECRLGFGDAAGWWGTQNINLFCSSGREAIEAGRLVYDPVQAEACAAMSVGDCNSIDAFAFGLNPQDDWLKSDACRGVVSGAVALGDDCHAGSTNYADECAEGFCSSNACPGKCSPYSEVGGPCDGVSTACDPATAYCNLQGKCQLFPERGQECSGSGCAPSDFCQSNQDETSSCVVRAALGENCAAGDYCDHRAVCYQGKCTVQVPLGEACVSVTNCPAGSYCDGTCKERIELNGDCSGLAQCIETLRCIDQTCSHSGEVGDDCPCDPGLWCDASSKCRSVGELGDDCTQPNQSAWGARCQTPLICVPAVLGASGPTSYECQPPGDLGELCEPLLLGTCQAPLFCDPQTYTCLSPAAEDESCNYQHPSDSCQAGLHCVCAADCEPRHEAQATCRPRLADEQDCIAAGECLSGICTNLKCAASSQCL